MINGVELIRDGPMSARGKRFFAALSACAPVWVRALPRYSGTRRVIVVYGPGDPGRSSYVARHRAIGGRVVSWDLAYWDRIDSLRVAVDELHPTVAHLALSNGTPRREFALREDADPRGHVLLVGLGRKSVKAINEEPLGWERRALAAARHRWPGARIVWRPKGEPTPLESLPMLCGVPIEVALRGARAVVCRHSNVAIDACVAGVPVVCEGGAAAALYSDNPAPDAAARRDFLRRLSWWEWHKSEALSSWKWLRYMLDATGGGVV